MSTVVTSPHTSCEQLTLADPTLRQWYGALKARYPGLDMEDPTNWLGMYAGGNLLAAIAYIFEPSGAVFLQCLVCKPTRSGRVAMYTLLLILRKIWAGRVVHWLMSARNAKMARLAHAFGAITHGNSYFYPTMNYWEVVA